MSGSAICDIEVRSGASVAAIARELATGYEPPLFLPHLDAQPLAGAGEHDECHLQLEGRSGHARSRLPRPW
jgi:hypothetical protein